MTQEEQLSNNLYRISWNQLQEMTKIPDERKKADRKNFTIPEKRPIHYELFCLDCGSPLFAIDDTDYDLDQKKSGGEVVKTITEVECILCRKQFKIETVGVKYEKAIREEIGWPFPEEKKPFVDRIPTWVKERSKPLTREEIREADGRPQRSKSQRSKPRKIKF